jgi:hypothetical protein
MNAKRASGANSNQPTGRPVKKTAAKKTASPGSTERTRRPRPIGTLAVSPTAKAMASGISFDPDKRYKDALVTLLKHTLNNNIGALNNVPPTFENYKSRGELTPNIIGEVKKVWLSACDYSLSVIESLKPESQEKLFFAEYFMGDEIIIPASNTEFEPKESIDKNKMFQNIDIVKIIERLEGPIKELRTKGETLSKKKLTLTYIKLLEKDIDAVLKTVKDIAAELDPSANELAEFLKKLKK